MNATSEIYYVQARSKAVSSFVWDMLSLRDDINFDLNGTAESHLCSVSLCCTNYFFFTETCRESLRIQRSAECTLRTPTTGIYLTSSSSGPTANSILSSN